VLLQVQKRSPLLLPLLAGALCNGAGVSPLRSQGVLLLGSGFFPEVQLKSQ
jgi:hypothetical protein